MFFCQVSKRLSSPGEKSRKLITHVRNRTYFRHNHKTDQEEPIGYGREIVQELTVCKDIYDKVMSSGFEPIIVDEE